MEPTDKKRVVLCVTGASGIAYAARTAAILSSCGCRIYCAATAAARDIAQRELGTPLDDAMKAAGVEKIFGEFDFSAPMASGSFYFDAMAVVPCSMKTLGKIANSIADNVVVRAAEVALKERRRLVVVPRETPLAATHLRNMLALARAGAVVLPAAPAFYNNPRSVSDIVDFVAARVAAAMGFRNGFIKEWGE